MEVRAILSVWDAGPPHCCYCGSGMADKATPYLCDSCSATYEIVEVPYRDPVYGVRLYALGWLLVHRVHAFPP